MADIVAMNVQTQGKLTNQSVNQSVNQQTHHPTNQPTSHPVTHLPNQSPPPPPPPQAPVCCLTNHGHGARSKHERNVGPGAIGQQVGIHLGGQRGVSSGDEAMRVHKQVAGQVQGVNRCQAERHRCSAE